MSSFYGGPKGQDLILKRVFSDEEALHNDAADSSSDVLAGDYAMVAKTGNLYEKVWDGVKQAFEYIKKIDLSGPKGDTGAAGEPMRAVAQYTGDFSSTEEMAAYVNEHFSDEIKPNYLFTFTDSAGDSSWLYQVNNTWTSIKVTGAVTAFIASTKTNNESSAYSTTYINAALDNLAATITGSFVIPISYVNESYNINATYQDIVNAYQAGKILYIVLDYNGKNIIYSFYRYNQTTQSFDFISNETPTAPQIFSLSQGSSTTPNLNVTSYHLLSTNPSGALNETLTLSADPTQDMEAATKQYVDNKEPDLSGYVTQETLNAALNEIIGDGGTTASLVSTHNTAQDAHGGRITANESAIAAINQKLPSEGTIATQADIGQAITNLNINEVLAAHNRSDGAHNNRITNLETSVANINNAGYITSSALGDYATQNYVNQQISNAKGTLANVTYGTEDLVAGSSDLAEGALYAVI